VWRSKLQQQRKYETLKFKNGQKWPHRAFSVKEVGFRGRPNNEKRGSTQSGIFLKMIDYSYPNLDPWKFRRLVADSEEGYISELKNTVH